MLTSLSAAYELNQARPGNLNLAESIARAMRFKKASMFGFVHTWEDTLPQLLGGAKTDVLAFDVAWCLAASITLEGGVIPAPLRDWTYRAMMELLPRPRSKGKEPLARRLRDRRIRGTVDLICGEHDLKPTRNEESAKNSACDMVADAMKRIGQRPMSYDAVRKIWHKSRDDQATPDWLSEELLSVAEILLPMERYKDMGPHQLSPDGTITRIDPHQRRT